MRNLILKFDKMLSNAASGMISDRPFLISFIFHGLFLKKPKEDSNGFRLIQRSSVDEFREFINYFMERGFIFVSPEEILSGLKDGKNHVLITFDDGYFNNLYALPVLDEFNVPAVFFVSTCNVRENKCFWWDIIYREGLKRGISNKRISAQIREFKRKKPAEIDAQIIKVFGKDSFTPKTDLERPMNKSELREFSQSNLVYIGNHTRSHAILTNHRHEEIKEEIISCQEELYEMTGKRPVIIAYPNGDSTKEAIDTSKVTGIKLGVTVSPHKNYLPIVQGTAKAMRLGRFSFVNDIEFDIRRQCEAFSSIFSVYNAIKRTKNSFYQPVL